MKTRDINLFAPFTRVDEEQRTVEGYCFVNEQVDGDAYTLKRSAMESATADYMRWGAVRTMHSTHAAGTANDGDPTLGVFWDDKGALLRARITDDDAWDKVLNKVYKGFSVGVRPKVMRGTNVETCIWVENSLVDRPADPEAKITIWRADDLEAEPEVEVVPDVEEVQEEPAVEPDGPETVGEEPADAPTPEVIEQADAPLITRVATLETELAAAIARADAAEAEIHRLSNIPAPTNKPVAKFAPVDRVFQANTTARQDEAAILRTEYEGLSTTLAGEKDEKKRVDGIVRMQVIRQELAALGDRL